MSKCFKRILRNIISLFAFWKISVWSSDGQRRKLGAQTIDRLSNPIFVLSTVSGRMKFCGQVKSGQNCQKFTRTTIKVDKIEKFTPKQPKLVMLRLYIYQRVVTRCRANKEWERTAPTSGGTATHTPQD